jgi:hypothetical protein
VLVKDVNIAVTEANLPRGGRGTEVCAPLARNLGEEADDPAKNNAVGGVA